MIRCKLSCAHLSGHAFENSISEPVAAAEMFGQLNRLVENDAVRRLRAAQQLIRPDEKNRTLNERYALQVAVDKRRKLSFKRSVLAEMGDPDEQYTVGEVVQFPTPDAQGQFAGRVAELSDEAVLFDFNHPLAGQPVAFEVHILGVL